MINDFIDAMIIGWLILFIFWIIVILFVYLRRPPNSKLTKKITLNSILFFVIVLGTLSFFRYAIRFFN